MYLTKKSSLVIIGLCVFVVLLQSFWLQIFAFLLDKPHISYHDLPASDITKYIQPYLWLWVLGIVLLAGIVKQNLMWPILFFISVIVMYTAIVGIAIMGPIISDYTNRTEFDSAAWKNRELVYDQENPVRLQMVDSLREEYQLVGMTREEIETLLGEPRPTLYFSNYDYVYWLGPERGPWGIDSEWLAIQFEDNAVTEAKILTD